LGYAARIEGADFLQFSIIARIIGSPATDEAASFKKFIASIKNNYINIGCKIKIFLNYTQIVTRKIIPGAAIYYLV